MPKKTKKGPALRPVLHSDSEGGSAAKKGPALRSASEEGFTIIELLTVMSIIIILIGVLVPALNKTRAFAKKVTQYGQFHEISKALELFRNDHSETYPDSGAADPCTPPVGYCGAMKLCEALLGQDGMGFNPLSQFTAAGVVDGSDLYPFDLCSSTDPTYYSGPSPSMPWLATNLQTRIKYIDTENVKAARLQDLYSWAITDVNSFYDPSLKFKAIGNSTPYSYPNAIITDVFLKTTIKSTSCSNRAGQKVGMPVLYYKADISKIKHDSATPPDAGVPNDNIYNFDDNFAITALGCPWLSAPDAKYHPIYADARIFLKAITNTKVTSTPRPHRDDGYILLSAGADGLYGTQDDVFNFSE